MKKIFLVMSVLALVGFMAGPAAALVGQTDDVPGSHLIGPYFLVSMPASTAGDNTLYTITETGGTPVQRTPQSGYNPLIPNLNPLFIPALVANDPRRFNTWDHGLPYGATGLIEWCIFNQLSEPCGCGLIPYTRNDVMPINMYSVIQTLAPANRARLEVSLEPLGSPDAVSDHWLGYIVFTDLSFQYPLGYYVDIASAEGYPYPNDGTLPGGAVSTEGPLYYNGVFDHLIGHMYQVDLLNGQATGATIPAREFAPRSPVTAGLGPANCADGRYRLIQNSAFTLDLAGVIPIPEFYDFEVFTGWALRETKDRERLCCSDWLVNGLPGVGVPRYFRMMARYFLYNQTASENLMFLWTSGNWGSWANGPFANNGHFYKLVDIYDEAEVWTCTNVDIPYELNVIDARDIVPSTWQALPAAGGWVDFRFDYSWANAPFAAAQFPQILEDGVFLAAEFLGYSWQLVDDTNPAINWSVSFPMHREAGTLVNPILQNIAPPPCQ